MGSVIANGSNRKKGNAASSRTPSPPGQKMHRASPPSHQGSLAFLGYPREHMPTRNPILAPGVLGLGLGFGRPSVSRSSSTLQSYPRCRASHRFLCAGSPCDARWQEGQGGQVASFHLALRTFARWSHKQVTLRISTISIFETAGTFDRRLFNLCVHSTCSAAPLDLHPCRGKEHPSIWLSSPKFS